MGGHHKIGVMSILKIAVISIPDQEYCILIDIHYFNAGELNFFQFQKMNRLNFVQCGAIKFYAEWNYLNGLLLLSTSHLQKVSVVAI